MTRNRESLILFISEVKWSEVAQSCPILCDPMDCSLPGSSVHGIFQARILEWVAISFSKYCLLGVHLCLCFELWCWRRLLRLLDSKEIKPVNSKGKKPWIFIGRTDAEALILWPSDAKSWLIRKDSDAGKDQGQEEKGVIEDEMVGGHHRLNGHEFEQTPGHSEGQGSLAWCSPWGCKELYMIERLNSIYL